MSDLPLTTSVTEIVISALEQVQDFDGLDRDEAYLLSRLYSGEQLEFVAESQ